MRLSHFALIITSLALGACGSSNTGAPGPGASGTAGAAGTAGASGAASNLAAPTFTQAERDLLATLSPEVLPAPGPDVSNRVADLPAAAALGQKLFFDPGFSGKLLDGDNDGSVNALGTKGETGKVACSGCHVPAAGFLDDRTLGKEISLAAGWVRRRTPSLLDVGQATLVTWGGRHDALYNQPFGPLESPVEMNSSRLFVAQQIFARYRAEYEALFGALPPLDDGTRFPALSAELSGCQPKLANQDTNCNGTQHGLPGDGAEFDGMTAVDQRAVTQVIVNMGKAIGAYERLLNCGPGRFDEWLHGNASALTASEQRGARIFVGSGKCVNCHSGPFMSDQKFHNVGLQPAVVAVVFIDDNDPGASAGVAAALADPLNVRGEFSDGDDGRLPSAVDESMTGAFRTPTLRCVARRPTFMHTGQMHSLQKVVSFFSRGGDVFGYPGKNELSELNLSNQDQADLVAFLGTLEGPGPEARLLVNP